MRISMFLNALHIIFLTGDVVCVCMRFNYYWNESLYWLKALYMMLKRKHLYVWMHLIWYYYNESLYVSECALYDIIKMRLYVSECALYEIIKWKFSCVWMRFIWYYEDESLCVSEGALYAIKMRGGMCLNALYVTLL